MRIPVSPIQLHSEFQDSMHNRMRPPKTMIKLTKLFDKKKDQTIVFHHLSYFLIPVAIPLSLTMAITFAI